MICCMSLCKNKNKKAISFESYLTISVEGLALEWDLSV